MESGHWLKTEAVAVLRAGEEVLPNVD